MWQFDLYKYSSVLGDYWKFIFTEKETGRTITDIIEDLDEEVTEQQAINCALRVFTNMTGLIYKAVS
jgi:hypothetical protein